MYIYVHIYIHTYKYTYTGIASDTFTGVVPTAASVVAGARLASVQGLWALVAL